MPLPAAIFLCLARVPYCLVRQRSNLRIPAPKAGALRLATPNIPGPPPACSAAWVGTLIVADLKLSRNPARIFFPWQRRVWRDNQPGPRQVDRGSSRGSARSNRPKTADPDPTSPRRGAGVEQRLADAADRRVVADDRRFEIVAERRPTTPANRAARLRRGSRRPPRFLVEPSDTHRPWRRRNPGRRITTWTGGRSASG